MVMELGRNYCIIFVIYFLFLAPLTSFAMGLKKQHTTWDTRIVDQNYKICVLGDTGSGSKHQYQVAQALKQEGCNQVRIVGDVIYPKGLKNKNDPQFVDKFINPYHEVIQSELKPKFFIALGNHDYDGNTKAWRQLHQDDGFLFSPHRYYAETYKNSNVCIATLDTSPFDSLKHFLKVFGHGSWIRKRTREFQKNCEFSIAFAHHPYINSGHHGDARAFLKRFLKRNIIGHFDLYIAGHQHFLSDEGQKQSTSLYISGAGGASLHEEPTHNPEGGFASSTPGYLVITLNRNSEQKIVAHTRFKTVTDNGVTTVHEKMVVGKGIR